VTYSNEHLTWTNVDLSKVNVGHELAFVHYIASETDIRRFDHLVRNVETQCLIIGRIVGAENN